MVNMPQLTSEQYYNIMNDTYHPFFIRLYLQAVIPLYYEKHQVMTEHRLLNKKRLILEFKFLDIKRCARQELQKKLNTHCVDNIMYFL